MGFANPILLFGLLAATIPIIIHLIHKRKPRQQPFPAIELLLRSVERVERRWRLRRILLLASRVLLLASLAMAAAGPLLGRDRALIASSRGPERLAIVVDASLSMRAHYDGDSAFERAIVAARNVVDRMGPEDQAVLVAARAEPQLLIERPTADRNQILEALERLRPSYEHADLGPAVSKAVEALSSYSEGETPPADGTPAPPPTHAKVVVLSDLQRPAFKSAAELTVPGSNQQAELELVDVLADVGVSERVNRAITSLETANVPGNVPRTIEMRARVQSFAKESSSSPTPIDLTLKSGEVELYAGHVEVVAGTIVDKVLRHAFERTGHIPIELVLENDPLVEDSVRYGEADVRRQVRTLIVDGAPSGLPKEDEIFYLERALAAGAADQPPPRVITADDLPRADLSGFDVIMMAGVSSFAPSEGARLVDFVKRGGGLFISISTDLDPELYNAELGPVLPRPFRFHKVVDSRRSGVGAGGVVTLAHPALDHPVLEIFQGDALGGLLSTRSNTYMMFQPGSQRAMQVLIEFDDGQPALLETSSGQGRVIVLATSIDRDLSDLAIRPAFVPLMRQLLLRLGDALVKPDTRRTLVGDVRELHLPEGASALRVTTPEGHELELVAEPAANTVRTRETPVPGHYKVDVSYGGNYEPLDAEGFSVNVDTRESDLRPLTLAEASAVLLGTDAAAETVAQSALARARALGGSLSPETMVTILLILMVVSFLLESGLTAQRIGR